MVDSPAASPAREKQTAPKNSLTSEIGTWHYVFARY
jgi:hypothetical protein